MLSCFSGWGETVRCAGLFTIASHAFGDWTSVHRYQFHLKPLRHPQPLNLHDVNMPDEQGLTRLDGLEVHPVLLYPQLAGVLLP